jgi:hypothetical protein
VIGEAAAGKATGDEFVAGKAAVGRPVSQETRPDRKADTPSRKGVALLKRTIVLALTGMAAMAAVAGGALAAAGAQAGTSGPAAGIRIEGAGKTLLLSTRARGRSGSITRYGAPKGRCPGDSIQGALDVATHGNWKGTWYSSYNEYLVTSIYGEKPSGSNFWELFVDNKAASKGACDVKLTAGQQILFADTDGKHYPSALDVVAEGVGGSSSGTTFLVKLLGYNAHGKAKPLAGVRITGNGVHSAKTNAHGKATVTDNHTGRLVLRAAPKGYLRSEAVVHVKH